MDGDESKEKCVYFMEEKHQDELFEVLELDDMDNVEVGIESNEPYHDDHDETAQVETTVKCETITSTLKMIFFVVNIM